MPTLTEPTVTCRCGRGLAVWEGATLNLSSRLGNGVRFRAGVFVLACPDCKTLVEVAPRAEGATVEQGDMDER